MESPTAAKTLIAIDTEIKVVESDTYSINPMTPLPKPSRIQPSMRKFFGPNFSRYFPKRGEKIMFAK